MKIMLTIQGLFYVLTGLWPLFSPASFMLVTGPKNDVWLLKTVGLLVTCSGMVFLYSGLINSLVVKEVALLAVMNALALSAIDIHYVRKGIISRIYLADAVVELAIAGFYLTQWN